MHRTSCRGIAGWVFAALVSLLLSGPGVSRLAGQSLQPSTAGIPDELLTVAERTQYAKTSQYADVVALLDALAAKYPITRRAEMGKTHEGRAIPMLIVADPPVDPVGDERIGAAQLNGRLVVLAFGNIHAGEVDGKEALPMLAREILMDPGSPENKELLKKLVIIFAPIYNADGNERVSKGIRGPQNGPEETGIRENAQGFDLNRDFVKVEAPETRALLRTIQRWDPAVVIDCHITNGSYHRYIVTYAGPKVPAGDARVIEYSRNVFFPGIAKEFHARTGWDSFWYGNFNGEWTDQREPHARWETFPAEGRYVTNGIGLRGRLSVLVETYTYAPFADRVKATVEFVRVTLVRTAAEAEEIRQLLAAADRDATEGGRIGEPVAIRSREAPWPGKVKILGFEEEKLDGHVRPTTAPREYEVELWDKFEAAMTVTRPYGYAIPPEYGSAIEALRVHGVWVQVLDRDVKARAEVYRVESATSASRAFQGHTLAKIEATARAEERTIPKGWALVRTSQPLGNLVVYLLEPQSEDGLGTWNFFDAGLKAGEDFPVVRVMGVPE